MHFYDLLVGCRVFTNKDDAIKLIKEKKGGRFKAFNRRIEAEEFSMNVSGHNCSTHAIEMVALFVAYNFLLLFIFVTTSYRSIIIKL